MSLEAFSNPPKIQGNMPVSKVKSMIAGCVFGILIPSHTHAYQGSGLINVSPLKEDQSITVGGVKTHCVNPFGENNIETIPGGIRVHFPKGSSTPGKMRKLHPETHRADLWGMGAICKLNPPENTNYFSLSYNITTPEDFDPGKGGKLFGGFCLESCPRGGKGDVPGFSIRPHSIQVSDSDSRVVISAYTYGYDQEKANQGQHHKSDIELLAGTTYNIHTEADFQTGEVVLSVSGKEIYRDVRDELKGNSNTESLQLFLSAFYGGKADWGPARDTYLDFTDIHLRFEE